MQLVNAIPDKWKQIMSSNYSTEHAFTTFELLIDECKISHKVYSKLNANKALPDKQRKKWENSTNTEYQEGEYKKLFTFPQKVTIATKYRDFQYRLLHSAIVTNRKLYLWKILPSDKCTFCKEQIERIPHLFFECKHVYKFWQEIREFIYDCENNVAIECDWSFKNIMDNQVHPRPANVINFLVLVAKQFIYCQRCHKNLPFSDILIREFEQIYEMELRIARDTNKLRRHYEKWSVIKPELLEQLIDLDNNTFIDHYTNML